MGTVTKLNKTLYGLSGTEWIPLSSEYLDNGGVETAFKHIEQLCSGSRQTIRFGNVVIQNDYSAYRIT